MSFQLTESEIRGYSFEEAKKLYRDILGHKDTYELRWMCRHDRYFLLTCILNRTDAIHPWLYERCREVEAAPEGYLDLWSRFHFKSSIITQAGSVQEILKDPEITIGIFSNVVPLARKFVGQIRSELERPELFRLFPDILYDKPPQRNWSEQNGLVVKRKSNPKEATVEAQGLVQGQRAGPHYGLRIYDDIVTEGSVGTPEMIEKTTKAWELSLSMGPIKGGREWYAGTRYHPNDTYQDLLQRKALKERKRTCYDKNGKSVLMPQEELDEFRKKQGERTFSCQMLQNPIGDGMRTFKDGWFKTLEIMPKPSTLNRYIIIDSANEKRKYNDFTTMGVIGLGPDHNYYLLDGIRDRLNLAERTRKLFELVQQWTPMNVFWEQVGLACDVQHVQIEQDHCGWHFSIEALGQSVPKNDRIRWLIPLAEAHRIWLPARILHQNLAGETYDFVHDFINYEVNTHPVVSHDDMLDMLANIQHPKFVSMTKFPIAPNAHVTGAPNRTKNDRVRIVNAR